MNTVESISVFLLLIGMVIAAALLIRSIRKDRKQKQVMPADPAQLPFPQHERNLDIAGFSGQPLQPSHEDRLMSQYQQWKERWVLADLEPGRAFMRMGVTKQGLRYRMLVTSEGQGLAMLCSVIFAGADPQAQGMFNQLYAYCKAHPSQKHADLMSWQVIAEAFPSIATDSATRGDLLIAYALLMADRQWGSAGLVNYLASAKAIISALKEQCVHPQGFYMLHGNWVDETMEAAYGQTNRSCMSPAIFKAFQKASGDLTWQKVSAKMKQLLKQSLRDLNRQMLFPPDVIHVASSQTDEIQIEGNEDDVALLIFHQLQAAFWLDDAEARTWLKEIGDTSAEPITGDVSADLIMCHLAGALANRDPQQFTALWDWLVAIEQPLKDPYADTWRLVALLVLNQNWWGYER